MLKYLNIAGALLLPVAMSLLGTSCQDRNRQVINPWYSGHYYPKSVKFVLDNKKGKTVEMQIDHMRKRIYNADPLPYGTKLDSAYLSVVMSNQLDATLRNLSEEKGRAFSSTDTGKIFVGGGKLELVIARKDRPTLRYDIRLMSYGYDPDKLTWNKRNTGVPSGVAEGRLIKHDGKHYYLTRDTDGKGKLYSADLVAGQFVEQQATLPDGLLPKTLYQDHRGNAWILDQEGHLYSATDLYTWQEQTPQGVKLSQILNDRELKVDKPTQLSVIGTPRAEEGTYYIYTVKADGMEQHQAVPKGFPIRDAFVYNYVISGTQHSNILGGITSDGTPAELSFFTSDGVRWGKTPYKYSSDNVPDAGGLYLMRRGGEQIMLVGGIYNGKISNSIKVSEDRGITWKSLQKTQLPGESFTPRSDIAGTVIVDDRGIEHIYLLGGRLSDGTATQEIWHGFLDTTGGIVNHFEN